MLFSFGFSLSASGEQLAKFSPLTKNESIIFLKQVDPNDSKKSEVVFYAKGNDKKRELYRCSGLGFDLTKNNSTDTKSFIFSTGLRNDIHDQVLVTLFLIDGKMGTVNTLYHSINFSFILNDTNSYLCIYDYKLSESLPVIRIYDFPAMNIVKEFTFVELKDKDIYPKNLKFENNSFMIDLMNDGPDFKHVVIPIQSLIGTKK